MRRLNLLALITAVALASACGVNADGPPEIQIDRTACAHCTMLISEPRYAAAYQLKGAEPRTFDDIGCLLDALSTEPQTPARIWFKDAQTSAWVDSSEAVFVRSDGIRTPMSGGVTAYADPKAAQDAAARHQGRVLNSIDELRASRGVR